MRWTALIAFTTLMAPLPMAAQAQDQTLADIRQELSVLYVEIQRLKRELSTTSAPGGVSGGTTLDRVNAIEDQLQRLTSNTETLEQRINRVVADGTNQIGDLEFRLCELESACDIATLGTGTTLGGAADPAPSLADVAETPTVAPELAVGEQADFERAETALTGEQYDTALREFDAFLSSYPGSPLASLAHIKRGDALTGMSKDTESARAYLEAFSGAPEGPEAAEALFKLGRSLGGLGQTSEACVMLGEVGIRFPSAEWVAEAEAERTRLICS